MFISISSLICFMSYSSISVTVFDATVCCAMCRHESWVVYSVTVNNRQRLRWWVLRWGPDCVDCGVGGGLCGRQWGGGGADSECIVAEFIQCVPVARQDHDTQFLPEILNSHVCNHDTINLYALALRLYFIS